MSRAALRRGLDTVTLDTDPGLAAPYTYNFPASAPTGGAQVIASNGATNVFYDVHPQNQIIVRKNPGPNEFSSIASAIASISGNSSINLFIVKIYSGVYTEPNFTIPAYVYLVGENEEAVKIQPSASGPFITINNPSGIGFLTIQNTDLNFPALLIENCGNYVILHKIVFKNCERAIRVNTDSLSVSDSVVYLETVKTFGALKYSLINEDDLTGVYGSETSITDFLADGHNDFVVICTGPKSEIFGQNIKILGDGTGTGFSIRESASLDLKAVYIRSTFVGIESVSDGGTPTLLLSGVMYEDNVTNINVLETNTVGLNDGYTSYVKTNYPKNSPFFVANKDQFVITVSKKGGDFTSVAAALASITDNSPINRYTIQVGPGMYMEPQLVMKEYVTLRSFFQTQTILEAVVPGVPFIVGAKYACLDNITIDGTVGNPPYLIEYLGTATGNHFRVDNVVFGTTVGGTLVHLGSTVGPCLYIQTDCIINQQSAFSKAFEISDTVGFPNSINMLIDGLVWIPEDAALTGFTKFMDVKSLIFSPPSPNVFGIVSNITVGHQTPSPTGVGIEIGGFIFLICSRVLLGGFATAFSVLNGAVPNVLILSNSAFYFNIVDINLQNPNGQGSITATASRTKVSVVSGASYGISLNELDGSIALTGQIYQGENWARITNITEQIQNGASLGVVDIRPTLVATGGLVVAVGSGRSYIFAGTPSDTYLRYVEFSATNLTLPDGNLSYIFVDSTAIVQHSLSVPDPYTTSVLGTAKTFGGNVTYVQETARRINSLTTHTDEANREVIGAIVTSGCISSPGSSGGQRAVQVSSGKYYLGSISYPPTGGDNVTMTGYYGGVQEVASITNLPLVWDNAGTLTPLGASEWTKHSIYLLSRIDGTCSYFMVYGQAVYADEGSAIAGPIPIPPATFVLNMLRSSTVRVNGSDPSAPLAIGRFTDVRPTLAFREPAGASTLDHNSLLNLTVGNAHPQYFRVDGTSTMAGSVNLGSQNIIGSGGNLILGMNILSHASRHVPGGLDPLPTAAPTSVGVANSEGVAASFSRSDHTHNHGAQTDPTQHALATNLAAGFLSASDFSKLAASTNLNNASTLVQRSASGDIQLSSLTLTSTTAPFLATIVPSPTNFGGPNHTITLPIPSTDDTIVLAGTQLTLSNKNLVDVSTFIIDDIDATKRFRFEASGISTTTTRIYTVPNQNTNLIGDDTTDTLTNKTITATSNNVTANALRTATASVNGSASVQPPGPGYAPITTGTGTTFTWQLASVGSVTSVGFLAPVEFAVAGSPVTNSGVITLSKATQTANRVWAGPVSGGAAQPTFRALVPADIPATVRNPTLTICLTSSVYTVTVPADTIAFNFAWNSAIYAGYTANTSYYEAYVIAGNNSKNLTIKMQVNGAGANLATLNVGGSSPSQYWQSGVFNPSAITPAAANQILTFKVGYNNGGAGSNPQILGLNIVLVAP
jgi:hypothetical protein